MSAIETIKNKIQNNEEVLLMFDYDGTLTPIMERPELAIIEPCVKENLLRLSHFKKVKVAIISGRTIKAIRHLTSIEDINIEMYGLHGGEILEGGKTSVNVSEKCKIQIKDLKKSVKELTKLDGILLEDKGYSLSLHYRLANSSDAQYAIKEFKNNVDNLDLLKDFRYQEGKKVVEVLPANFNKAKVVNFLVNKYPEHLPVYFGDDKTDVFAFKEVKKHNGLSVVVGDEDIYEGDFHTDVNGTYDFLESALITDNSKII